jgi:hypothetical protein
MLKLFPILLVLTFHFSLAWAQVTTATISGVVQDSTGGVLPGVEVNITHLDTNNVRATVTDDTGRYSARALALGRYEVSAELAGFQSFLRQGLELTLGMEAVINITLSVGAITEQVIVSGAAPLVETTSSQVSGLVGDKKIRDLPLNGRSFTELAVLQPGVVTARAAGRSLIVGQGQKISVNGSRINASSNDSMGQSPGSVNGVVLGVETVREFQTITSNFSAEYGRAAGGVISAVTKSGTNQLHGSLFEFHRNSALDAKNFFDRRDEEIPDFTRNQFGFVIGGPIVKDKTFFLGSVEAMRNREGTTTPIRDLPNADAHQGLLPVGEISSCADVRGELCFIGIDPLVQPYLNLYPLPNGKDNGDGSGEWNQIFNTEENEAYFLIKIDHNFSDSDTFFARYTFQDADSLGPSDLFDVVNFADNTRNQYATIEEKHIFSPALLNVARFGFNRSLLNSEDGIVNPATDDPALAFIPGFERMGRLGISGMGNIGRSFNRPRFRVLNVFEYSDTVSYNRGRHSVKFGVNYKRYQQNHNQSNNEFGLYSFRSIEDFLMNTPGTFSGAKPCCRDYNRGDRHHIPAVFFQDDFQVTPNLMLNLGLRWEAASANKEVNGKQSTINVQTDPAAVAASPNYTIPKNNFAPRVGFAWDPSGSGTTALRGGFGMFHQMVLTEVYFGSRQMAPFIDLLSTTDRGGSTTTFPNPLAGAASGAAIRVESVDASLVSPYYMQYNLNLQRELVSGLSLMVGYVGSRGVNLMRYTNPDNAIPDILPDGRFYWPDKRDTNTGLECFTSDAACVTTQRRNPNFTRVRLATNGSDSWYNSLQTSLQKRFADNYQFQISYTYSKSIDTSSQLASSDFSNAQTLAQNYYDNEAQRSVSTFHMSHVVSVNYSWELPFAEGSGGALEAILGGWTLNGIVSLTSGTPLSIELSDRFDNERDRTNGSESRATLIPGGDNNPVLGDPAQWLDPSQFIVGPPGFLGDVGRLTARGDDFSNVDFSLGKNAELAEDVTLQFRAEFFNVFNHPNFRHPSRALITSSGRPSSSFGRVTATDNSSRQVQFAVKFLF